MDEEPRLPLVKFVEAAHAQGASDELVAELLERRGWPRKEVYAAFDAMYERLAGIPMPRPGSGSFEAARDAFLYLLSFGTLGTWTGGLGSLFFTLIDAGFPDPLSPQQVRNFNQEISGALASLIVAFPAYLLTMRILLRGVREQPERLESGVRKWLTYIALLIAAAAVIGDLVTFLSYFLRGDLTTRFLLKVLTVLVIAAGVFAYYLLWLERPAERRREPA
jgi:hypothetical protein